MNKFSYKALDMINHSSFVKNKSFVGPMKDIYSGKIVLEKNLLQVKEKISNNYKNQSLAIYKFDNSKLGAIYNHNEQKIFASKLNYNAVVKVKEIHFDDSDVSSYFKTMEELENYFEK